MQASSSKSKRQILILDDEREVLLPLCEAFRGVRSEIPNEVTPVSSEGELLRFIRDPERRWDLVVMDLKLGDGKRDGIEILKEIRKMDKELPVVIVSDVGTVEDVFKAVKCGANDFLVRSGKLKDRVILQLEKVRRVMELVDENRRLRIRNQALLAQNLAQQDQLFQRQRIVGSSSGLKGVLDAVKRVASIPRPVLIIGERGTGKELVARAIHRMGDRSQGPFIVVNCAAFSETLLESEIFGHEKGAFTGAERRRIGKFEQANGGILFFDEIGNMPLSFQQKILRVIEYQKFERVGGDESIEVDTRIIAATNADLEIEMEEGRFRKDLYDRLSFEVIHIPPLRERPQDIEELAQYFMDEFMREVPGFQGKVLSKAAIEALRSYHFPGNVRELKNIIERAVYRDTTNEITPEDLELTPIKDLSKGNLTFHQQIELLKRELIEDALKKTGGNQRRSAKLLGLTYDQFRHYYKKYRPN
jgi:psp operon transcriptional activator PspF